MHVVIGRFTRVGQPLSAETPGLGTTFVLTAAQFDHFKSNGFADAELDNAAMGAGAMEVFSRVNNAAATSGSFNILTAGRGIQFGAGNAGANQTVSDDEIRMGSSLDAMLPVTVPTSAVVSLTATQPLAPEPVAGNEAPGEIPATRTGSTASVLSVPLAVSGTATAGKDFPPIPSLVFPPGEDTVTLAIRPFTDALAEGCETVVLTLAAGPGYAPGDRSEAAVTVTDRPFDIDASKSRFSQKPDAGIPQKIVIYGTVLTASGRWSAQIPGAPQSCYPGLVSLGSLSAGLS